MYLEIKIDLYLICSKLFVKFRICGTMSGNEKLPLLACKASIKPIGTLDY